MKVQQSKKKKNTSKPPPKEQPPHPLDLNINFFSRITFSWLFNLIALGRQRELENEDVFKCPSRLASLNNINKFDDLVAQEIKKEKPKFSTVIWTIVWYEYTSAFVYSVPFIICYFFQPLFIRGLLRKIEGNEDPFFIGWSGISLSIGLTLTTVLMSLSMQNMWGNLLNAGAKARSIGMSYIFKKALKLAPHSRQQHSVGSLVTLMTVDLDRVFYWIQQSNWLVVSPSAIIFISYIVVNEIGAVPSMCGGIVLIILTVFSYYTATVLKRARIKVMRNTERRVHLIEELLQGIRVIKSYAWEGPLADQVEDVRKLELKNLGIMLFFSAVSLSVAFITPVTVGLISFYVYALQGNELTASVVFTTFAAINLLRLPVKIIPMVIARYVEAVVSFKRLTKFMCLDELEDNPFTLTDASTSEKYSITMKNCIFAWSPEKDSFRVKVPELNIKRGDLVCVIGVVGCGKTSLLSCILGELLKIDGTGTRDKTGYVSQKAWIQNCSLKDAILFGNPYNKERYEKTIEVAQLTTDLLVLPNGDATEIGERGINLSGGQKQRVAIARLIYSADNIDLCIFDDPLSAVDVHVASALFEEAICGSLLKEKTRILTLNSHYHLLQHADYIVVMEDGTISAKGSYEQVANMESFKHLISSMEETEEENDNDEGNSKSEDIISAAAVAVATNSPISSSKQVVLKEEGKEEKKEKVDDLQDGTGTSNKLIKKEDRTVGSVGLKTLIAYYDAASNGKNGALFCSFVLFTFVLAQGIRTVDDVLLSQWSKDSSDSNLFTLYAVFAGLTFLFYVLSSLTFVYAAIRASKVFHARIFSAILEAPINTFYDVTPVGQILNRFTKDIDQIDMLLPDYQVQFIQNALYFVGAAILCVYSNPFFALILPVLLVLFVKLGAFYRAALRTVKRLESISRSPIFSTFSEAMNGLSTIRSFTGHQKRTLEKHYESVDLNTSLFHAYWLSGNWYALRVDTLGSCIAFFVSLFAIVASDYGQGPEIVGLALTFAVQFTSLLQWTVRCALETESNMTSVERLHYYASSIPKEKSDGDELPSKNWPEKGEIEMSNCKLRYRDGLPLVLKGVDLKIKSGEKIGVVGRTGAGKSSLVIAFLRIVELVEGFIKIDGVDLSKLKLKDIRSVVSLIPQTPFLFSGTLRMNLDPFNEYTDDKVWQVLEQVHLKQACMNFPNKLLYVISDQGSNLSAGQQQLICVARALLRGSKVILLDEATANVDSATDTLIQETIQTAFKGATTLTIAHRLDTVMVSDRILVMDDGKVSEFDTPANLLKNEHGIFYGLVEEWKSNNEDSK